MMKLVHMLIVASVLVGFIYGGDKDKGTAMKNVHDFTLTNIDGEEVSLSVFKGRKMLLVNVASHCGNTPQYEDLQTLHETYGDQLVVIGLPANNFGKQEPGTSEEIKEFCSTNYSVTFTLMEKISVKGKDQHPLYDWLTDPDQNGWNDKEPNWNFSKYMIDENGALMHFYEADVKPLSDQIIAKL